MEKKDATDGMVLGFEIPKEERTPTMEQLLRIIIEQREEIARLREEINRLKGVPPQPQRKPSMLGQDEPPRSDTSKKSRRKKRKGKRPGSDKRKKTSELRIDDIVPCVPESLPDGAVRVSYRDWVVQDLVIRSHNVCYRREIYQLPDGSFIAGELPVQVAGHFGATLRSYVLYQHYQNHVTQPLILEELRDLAVDISAGQIDRLLHQGHEAFFQEKASLLPAAREVSQYFHTDDTSARHRGKNGHTTVISNQFFASFSTTDTKSRINFLEILRSPLEEYVVGGDALFYMDAKAFRNGGSSSCRQRSARRAYLSPAQRLGRNSSTLGVSPRTRCVESSPKGRCSAACSTTTCTLTSRSSVTTPGSSKSSAICMHCVGSMRNGMWPGSYR